MLTLIQPGTPGYHGTTTVIEGTTYTAASDTSVITSATNVDGVASSSSTGASAATETGNGAMREAASLGGLAALAIGIVAVM